MSKMNAQEWNKQFPIGTAVLYHPIIGEPECEESKTRSEAWELGHGESVVKIEGRTGGVCLDAVKPLSDSTPTG